jgi:RNA polymerase sigma-70 factor (ECF subfamily)
MATETWALRDLERAFRDHHARVFAAAYRVTGNAMDAEDVLQGVFLRLARGAIGRAPSDSAELGAYLQRAAVNGALDLIRHGGRHPAVPLDAARGESDSSTDASTEASRLDVRDRIRAALAELSPRAAEMFALRYLEGFSNQEIGRLVGTSESTVGVTLFRARAQLRAALDGAADLA